jgi:hypothetical protein
MTDTCGDSESVQSLVKSAGWRRIGIDGVDAVGNAEVAAELAEALECPTLNVADYLHQNQGGYVDFIDYPALQAAVSSMPAFVLSGLCLTEVLENLGARLDGNIYIKRMQEGLWLDEDDCVFPDGIDTAIEALTDNLAAISRHLDEADEHPGHVSDDYSSDFVLEIMHYHDQWQPQESADVVFERVAGQ